MNTVNRSALEAESISLRKRLEELKGRRSEAQLKLSEQAESYSRVNERLQQSNGELRARERQLGELQQNIKASEERSRALFGGAAGDNGETGNLNNGHGKGSVSPEETIQVLREQLDDIGAQLGVAPAIGANVPVSTSETVLTTESVQVVTVSYRDQAYGFRIPSSYTFADLTGDACRFWNLDPSQSTLRDTSNSIWPINGNIRSVLLEELIREQAASFGQGVSLPKLCLIGNEVLVEDRASSDEQNISGGRPQDALLDEQKILARLVVEQSSRESERARNKKYKERVRKARVARAATLSEFFHDPSEHAYERRDASYESAAAMNGDLAGSSAVALGRRRKRDFLQKQTRALGTCIKLLVWFVFVVLLGVACALRYNPAMMFSNVNILGTTLTEPFPMTEPLKFSDHGGRNLNSHVTYKWSQRENGLPSEFPFSQIQDFYNFAEVTLVEAFFVPNFGLLNEQQVMLGPMVMRQNRVVFGSCRLNENFISAVGYNPDACLGSYSAMFQDETDFGEPIDTNTSLVPGADYALAESIVSDAFTYIQPSESPNYESGHYSAYKRQGNFLVMPSNVSTATAMQVITWLRDGAWVDLQTRAISISFVLYNANIDVLSLVTVLIEYSNSGDVHTTTDLRRAAIHLYNKPYFPYSNVLLILADAVGALYGIWILYRLIVDMIVYGTLRALSTVWNFVSLILFILIAASNIVKLSYSLTQRDTIFLGIERDALESHLNLYDVAATLDTLTLALGTVYIFKFTQGNRKVSALFETTHRTWPGAAALVFMLFLILAALFLVTSVVYVGDGNGYLLISFANLLLSSLDMMNGRFPVTALRDYNPFYTFFFVMFFLLVFSFLSLALITAIYIDAYFEVQAVGMPNGQPTHFWSDTFCSPFVVCWQRRKNRSQKRAAEKKLQ